MTKSMTTVTTAVTDWRMAGLKFWRYSPGERQSLASHQSLSVMRHRLVGGFSSGGLVYLLEDLL
jgi:hypothetical protein